MAVFAVSNLRGGGLSRCGDGGRCILTAARCGVNNIQERNATVPGTPVDLSKYDNSWYDPGRGLVGRLVWHCVNVCLIQNPLNLSSSLKIGLLRLFGAGIGGGVTLKPGINVKYPWHVEIGVHSWIGENVWIDSLAPVKIGANVCISQGAYLCTGNHDWTDPAFGLMVKPIIIEDGAWIGAHATVLPGVVIAGGSVITAGSVAARSTEPYMIYAGNPAVAIKKRLIRER